MAAHIVSASFNLISRTLLCFLLPIIHKHGRCHKCIQVAMMLHFYSKTDIIVAFICDTLYSRQNKIVIEALPFIKMLQ